MNISIIITTYNAAQFIAATVASIVQQTYKNYEILIVDDGSSDETVKIITNLIEIYAPVAITLHAKTHLGRAAILNEAIQLASYDWIAILDADDLWHPHKLSLQVQMIQQHCIQFLATQSKSFSEQNEITYVDMTLLKPIVKQISLNEMLLSNLICHSSILSHKKLLHYDKSRKSQIDYALWLKLLNEEQALYILNMELSYHRIHAEQNFESKMKNWYLINTIKLQLKYALKRKKIFLLSVIICKIGYYFFLPRPLRLKIREFFV